MSNNIKKVSSLSQCVLRRHHNDVSGKRAAVMFFQELLDSVEALTCIAVEHGARTLADLMYLQNAILNGGFIDHYPDESKVLEIASALSSGKQWSTFIKAGYMSGLQG